MCHLVFVKCVNYVVISEMQHVECVLFYSVERMVQQPEVHTYVTLTVPYSSCSLLLLQADL